MTGIASNSNSDRSGTWTVNPVCLACAANAEWIKNEDGSIKEPKACKCSAFFRTKAQIDADSANSVAFSKQVCEACPTGCPSCTKNA